MNTELLDKVLAVMEENAEYLDLSKYQNSRNYSTKKAPQGSIIGTYCPDLWGIREGCGTLGCIAGWTCHVAKAREGSEIFQTARDLLGLADHQAEFLFYAHTRYSSAFATDIEETRIRIQILKENIDDPEAYLFEILRKEAIKRGWQPNPELVIEEDPF